MTPFQFDTNPLWLNLIIFGVAAAVIWVAGTRLEHYAGAIADKTGLGRAFVGLILLATATSLPELGTTVTALLRGNTSLAVHNLLGGVVMQTAILVIVDAVEGRGALTRFTPSYVLLIQGVGLILMLAAALVAMSLGGTLTLGGDGWEVPWPALLLAALFVAVVYLSYRARNSPRWRVVADDSDAPTDEAGAQSSAESAPSKGGQERRLRWLFALFGGLALVVLAGGWAVASVADVLAEQTGLGAGFIGATLVALSTSLPELSTTIAAGRKHENSLAISNIFGSNAFDVMLLGLVVVLGGSAALNAASASALFAGSLGILMTGIFLWGLLERDDRLVWRLGWDAVANLFLYVAGTYVLYLLR
jgi:cation:H+ antiporter